MEEGTPQQRKNGMGWFAIPMLVLPLGFLATMLMFGTGPDGTCLVNRRPCGEIEQMSGWIPAVVTIVGCMGFIGFAIRGATGGKERRRALAAGTSPVVARLLAIEGTGTTVNDSPKLRLEMELPDGTVVADQTLVPLHLMNQLRPGENVPILLANGGGYFKLDVETMSRVQPAV